jgi:hypothetical protein
MSHYNFVHDTSEIKHFYDLFYKDTFKDDIVYMIHLACRKKYLDEIKCEGQNKFLNRIVIKDDSYYKFLSLLYSYNSDKRSLENLPQESLVLYASLNPRSTFKALTEFNKKIAEWTYNTIIHKEMNTSIKNITSTIKSCIQGSSYESRFIQLDLDKKEQEYVDILENFLNDNLINVYCIIETRGGFHYILNSNTLTGDQKKNIFNGTLKNLKFDTLNRNGNCVTKNIIDIISNNPMSPIPGTYQGGFPVKFVKLNSDITKFPFIIIKDIFKVGGVGITYEIMSPCNFTLRTGDLFGLFKIKQIETGHYDFTQESFYFTKNQDTCLVQFIKEQGCHELQIGSRLYLGSLVSSGAQSVSKRW